MMIGGAAAPRPADPVDFAALLDDVGVRQFALADSPLQNKAAIRQMDALGL